MNTISLSRSIHSINYNKNNCSNIRDLSEINKT